MKKLVKPFLFALSLLPIAAAGGFFTCLYQFEMYSPEIIQEAVSQLGSEELLIAISVAQTAMYALFCGFFGYVLASKTGLWKPFKFEKKELLLTVIIGAIFGIIFSLDYWTFGNAIPGIKEATALGLTVNSFIASVLYGGIVEEVMLRLFFMSLIAFIIWKLFFRKTAKENIPAGVFAAANIIAAMAFAAGHLPATLITFGELSALILFRCFLLNGGFGMIFGWLYRKHGIWYAMLCHALIHIVSKLILICFA